MTVATHLNRVKYYCLRYQLYLLGALFFLTIFAVWGAGHALGFESLQSLLAGIVLFLLLSAGYVLLLYRGAAQHRNLDSLLRDKADHVLMNAPSGDREAIGLLRERLLHCIARMRSDKPQRNANQDALYAQPWYLMIGQPASGKSSMILQSGLNFLCASKTEPSAGSETTEHCDWFLGSDAVLLDTAGGYMENPEDAGKWTGLLQLLRQHRSRRPLNGLIVSVSVADILHASAEHRERLARRLRERIRQAGTLLEIRLPIYLVFTKCDRIPGFTGFFHPLGDNNSGEVMGKTFSHKDHEHADWSQRFDPAMDELLGYWRQVADQRLTQQDIQLTRRNDSAYRFPLELAALQPRLKQFIDHLLQANHYQKPEWLRGFYFTAALEAGENTRGRHCEQVTRNFALQESPVQTSEGTSKPAPRFISGLFSKVIVPDQHLVTLYPTNHRERQRKFAWIGASSLAAMLLCGLWGWSYHHNSSVLQTISVELVEAASEDRAVATGYTAWNSLDRLRFWAHHYYRQHREQGVPLRMGWGLYQGHDVEPLLRAQYFSRLQQVMLDPVADNLTRTLYQLTTLKVYQRNTPRLMPISDVDSVEAKALPQDNRAQSIADFGKATLDTYVMLSAAGHDKADPAWLKARLPDYWYPAIARHVAQPQTHSADYPFASRQIDFYSEQIQEVDVPRVLGNAFLISSSRNYINSLLSHSLRAIETITLESDTLFAFARADFQGPAKRRPEPVESHRQQAARHP